MMNDSHDALLETCKELREATAACFRVINRSGQAAVDDLERELRACGIADGLGVRAQLVIANAEKARSVLERNENVLPPLISKNQ